MRKNFIPNKAMLNFNSSVYEYSNETEECNDENIKCNCNIWHVNLTKI